jgi:type I restriction enzyme S subunit
VTGNEHLPVGWAEASLGSVAEIVRGVTYKKAEARATPEDGFIPIVRATNINGALNLESELVYVPVQRVSTAQRLRPGDIIVAASSGSLSVVGKSAELREPWTGAFGAFCSVIRPSSDISRGYIARYVTSPQVRESWRELAKGTNINNLKASDVEATPVPIPPHEEQERIVDAIEEQFSRLDAGVAALLRVRRNLHLMRAAVLDGTITGALLQGERGGRDSQTELREILDRRRAESTRLRTRYREPASPLPATINLPAHWNWASLDMLAASDEAITDGPFGSHLKTAHYTESGPRVIRLQNVGDGEFIDAEAHISFEHYKQLAKHAVERGDLVGVLLGETLPRACMIPDSLGPAIVKADCPRIRLSTLVNNRYVWAALNAPTTRADTSARVHGVGRPRLNLKELREIPIPLPPRAEQDALVATMERELSEIEHLRVTLASHEPACDALRASILTAAFSGTLVAQDPSDLPAAVMLDQITERRASARPDLQDGTRQRRRKVTA